MSAPAFVSRHITPILEFLLARMMSTARGGLFLFVVLYCPLATCQFKEPSNKFSRLSVENTAEVLPGFTFGFQTSAPLFDADKDPLRFRGLFGISGIAEIDVTDAGFVRSFTNEIAGQPSWGLKLGIVSGQDQWPAVAVTVRNSIVWNSAAYYWYDIESERPDLYRKGLGNVWYEYGFTTFEVVVTTQLRGGILLSGGLGLQDVKFKNAHITGTANNADFPERMNYDGLVHNVSQDGFFCVVVPIQVDVAALAEVAAIPVLTPNAGLTYLTDERAYTGSLGVRYDLSPLYSVDAVYTLITDLGANVTHELRIGINLFATLQ